MKLAGYYGYNEDNEYDKEQEKSVTIGVYGLSNAVTRTSQDVASYDRATTLEGIGWQVATMEPQQWKQINQ